MAWGEQYFHLKGFIQGCVKGCKITWFHPPALNMSINFVSYHTDNTCNNGMFIPPVATNCSLFALTVLFASYMYNDCVLNKMTFNTKSIVQTDGCFSLSFISSQTFCHKLLIWERKVERVHPLYFNYIIQSMQILRTDSTQSSSSQHIPFLLALQRETFNIIQGRKLPQHSTRKKDFKKCFLVC